MRGFLTINRKFSNLLASSNSGTLSLAQCAGIRFTFSSTASSSTEAHAATSTKSNNNNNKATSRTKAAAGVTTIDRLNFSPHEFWVTQGQGMERPFTGDKWFEKDVGYYHCTVCEKRLFTWDHKYQSATGMATFWHHEKNAVTTSETSATHITESTVNLSQQQQQQVNSDQKSATCSGCHSHLGLVHFDGPPPTFKRFAINSAAIKFLKKEHWENPHFVHKKRKVQKLTNEEEQTRKRTILKEQQEREAALSSSSSGSSSSSSSSSQSE